MTSIRLPNDFEQGTYRFKDVEDPSPTEKIRRFLARIQKRLLKELTIAPKARECLTSFGIDLDNARASGVRADTGKRINQCLNSFWVKDCAGVDKKIDSFKPSKYYLLFPYKPNHSHPEWMESPPNPIRFRRLDSVKSDASSEASKALCPFLSYPLALNLPFAYEPRLISFAINEGPIYLVQGELNCLAIKTTGRFALALPTSAGWKSQWAQEFSSVKTQVVLDMPHGPSISEEAYEYFHQAFDGPNGSKTKYAVRKALSAENTPLRLLRRGELHQKLCELEKNCFNIEWGPPVS